MAKHYGIDGVGTLVELGKGGPKINNSAGVVEARNNANNAYTIVRGASPVGADDFTTLSFSEANFTRYDSAPSYGFIPGFLPTLSFSDTTFQVTLTDPTGGWKYDRTGVRCAITGNKSIRLVADPGGNPAPAAGVYYVYTDAVDGTLVASTSTPWTLEDTKVPCAIVAWDDSATPKYHLADELHTSAIPRRYHWEHHFADGAELMSGGTISGYVVNEGAPAGDTDNTFAIAETTFADEDKKIVNALLADPNGTDLAYVYLTRTGAATYGWGLSAVPFKYTDSGYINWNNGGTTTEGVTGKFYCSYLLATNFAGVGRYMCLSGRGEYASVSEAAAESIGLFNFDGFPVAECIVLYQFIWGTDSTYTTKGKVRLAEIPHGLMISAVALRNQSQDIQIHALNDLVDVAVANPTIGSVVTWNGSLWIPGPPVTSSASAGIEWWPDTTDIIAKTTENDFVVETLGKNPVTTTESIEAINCASNTVIGSAYLYNTALGRTTLDGGAWSFDVWSSVSSTSAGRVSRLTLNLYYVRPYTSPTVTITGSGTSRTVDASSGTPFASAKIDPSATNTTASYLQTPKGCYQITARAGDTQVTIATPTGYGNESTVAFSVWKKFGGATTNPITALTTNYTMTPAMFASAAVTIEATDKLGLVVFGTSNNTTTVNYVYNGSTRYSRLSSPLVTLHNNLAGINAVGGNYQHLTDLQLSGLTGGTSTTLHSHAVPTTITVAAEASDLTCYPLFVTGASGDLAPKTHALWGFDALNCRMGLGTATPIVTFHAANDSYCGGRFVTHNDATSGDLSISRTRGTQAVPTIVVSGDVVGSLWFSAYDGTTYRGTARIYSSVDGTPGSGDMPGKLIFATTADGANAPTDRVVIDQAGNMGVGVAVPAYPLHVSKSWANSYGSTAKLTNVSNLTTNGSLYNTVLEIDATGTSVSGGVVDSGYKTGLQISNYAVGYAFAGTISGLLGFRSLVGIGADATAGAVVTNAYGAQILGYNLTAGTTVTNSYGVFIDSRNSAIGTITNAWDVYASNAVAKNYFAGNVGIGVAAPSNRLHVVNTTALAQVAYFQGPSGDYVTICDNSAGQYSLIAYNNIRVLNGHLWVGSLCGLFSISGTLLLGANQVEGARIVTTTNNFLIGTTDDDGTPATGRLVVQGAGTGVYANIFVGRDSNGANVTTLDCVGSLATTSLYLRKDTGSITNLLTLHNNDTLALSGTGILFSGYNNMALITAYSNFSYFAGSWLKLQTYASELVLNDGITITRTDEVLIPSGVILGKDATSGTANVAGYLKMFAAGDNVFYNTFTSGINTANATYTWPLAMPTSSGYVLSCTDAGVMSWAAAPAAATMTVVADTTDQTCYPLFVNGATGDLAVKTHAAFGFDALNGWLGVGIATPSYTLDIRSSATQASLTVASIYMATVCTADIGLVNTALSIDASSITITAGVTDGNSRSGIFNTVVGEGAGFAGTQSYMFGSRSYAGIGSTAAATAAVLNCYGGGFYCQNQKAGATITNAYAVYANSKNVVTGTITNAWDFYGASATSYNYFAGSVGVGITAPAAKLHILKQTADAALPALFITGKSLYGTGDDDYGFAYYLGYNLTSNRQLIIVDTQSNYGLRFMSNYIDGFNKTAMDRMDLNLGSDSNGVHVGTPLANTQFSASNYNGTTTKIVCEILGANAQSGNFLNISSFATPNTGDILSVASTGNMFLGTTDVDGTPPIGRLVVRGSTNDGTTNIFVGRDSDGANVATLDTDGNLVLVPFTGITRTGKLDVNNTNSSTVVVRGVSATWQATTVDISKIEFSSWVLDSGSVISGRISTRLNDPGNTFASDLLLWATPVAGTPVEYVRLKSTGNLLVGYSAETSPVSRLVVKGSTNNASTNIFTGLDSDDAAQFVINTDGQVTTGSWHATTLAYDHGGTGLTAYPKKTIILPAAAAALGTTTPATRETREIGATALPVFDVLKFPHASIAFAWWKFILPDSYDGGTITAKISYTNIATDSTNKFLFTISAACLADGGPLDVTMGTAVELEATVADTAEDVKIASWGTAITPSGTPAGGQVIIIKLQRDPADTTHDTTSLDAYVLDLAIEYTTNSYSD